MTSQATNASTEGREFESHLTNNAYFDLFKFGRPEMLLRGHAGDTKSFDA